MTQRIVNPFPQYLDKRGNLLDGGYVYIGTAGADPQTSPIATYWDAALTLPAVQPLRTLGGVIVNNGSPAFVFVDEDNYSLRVRDNTLDEVFYVASVVLSGVQFQPLDADLTAIAALATTAFGRSLLTLANQAALKSATGIPDCLPLTGGTVTGNVIRSAAGAHTYHTNSAFQSGRIFTTAAGAADPTSLPGDIWFEEE